MYCVCLSITSYYQSVDDMNYSLRLEKSVPVSAINLSSFSTSHWQYFSSIT